MAAASEQKKFALEVDAEHKSTQFKVFSVANPHMRAFHLSWVQFFCCFVSSFAAPPLLPVIRDNLGLSATDIGNAGIASVSGVVFSRLMMGSACDMVGPRLASAVLTLITAPAVYCTSVVDSAMGYLLVRFFTGFSLATFVSTSFWMSSMFSPPLVARANGIAAGWGNLGGGATHLLMPIVYDIIHKMGSTSFTAWRISFFIPGILQMCSAFAVMVFGQDLPDGNYRQLKKSGEMQKEKFTKIIFYAVTNYRAWITALCYGYSLGVELTVDNIIAQYFYDKFNLKLHTAGLIAASFGLANVFARPGGGFLSDYMSKAFGMRGRLWSWWFVQTLSGVFCIALGLLDHSLIGSIVVMVIFSVFIQAACGLTFGVVPFVSRRALGVVSGMTGAGGNIGAVLTQYIFFTGSKYPTEKGIVYMGIMMIACTIPICFIHFKQWGGMILGPTEGYTEEDYYLAEYTKAEREQNKHEKSVQFSHTSRNERSVKPTNDGSGSGSA
ncbi:hypothetical protein V2J09_013022 [Rumex salicifolius]